VVGTNIGGTGECIPNDGVTGLVVPAGDPAALAQAIGRLLDTPPDRTAPPPPRFWSDVAQDYAGVIAQLRVTAAGVPTALPDPQPIPYAGPPEPAGGK
jgi:glycosyltransferase involved in cell wall biosynthesis